MISNRNIAKDAGISPSKIAGGLGTYSLRNVLRVAKPNNALYTFLAKTIETNHLFSTIQAAMAYAVAYDVVYVEHGVYTETGEIVLDEEGMKLIGANTSGIEWGPTSIKSTINHSISVEANGCEISGMGFIQNGAYRCIDIDSTGFGAAIYKTHIHDCHFGNSAGLYSVYISEGVDTIVEDCESYLAVTAGIILEGSRSKIRNNIFFVPSSGIGIQYVPTAGDTPQCLIENNRIVGTGTTDVGIQLDGTPSAGTLMMTENKIFGCATTITATSNGSSIAMNNYTGAEDGAITVIDTDS